MSKYNWCGLIIGFIVLATVFFFVGRSVGIDTTVEQIVQETQETETTDWNKSYNYYPQYDKDEQFEREMIERLAEVLQDSKGDISFEKNAMGIETFSIKITWGE